MRTVFFGTPAIAVPALRALAATTDLVGVVCQPDRPAGRGLALREPAVKRVARELGVEVHQPVKVKTGNLHDWLAERDLDVVVVMAYGRILPPAVLSAPRRGCLNLHASLLPKYRGAAPIQWALIRGEPATGISLMQMDEGLDTGPVYARRSIPIGSEETAAELGDRLAELAAEVVRLDVPRAVLGELSAEQQDSALATFAPPIEREHTEVVWARPAAEIVNLIRGLYPRPGANCKVRGKTLRLARARPEIAPAPGSPGTVSITPGPRVLVAASDGSVEILRAQLEGRKELSAAELVNGRTLRDGELIT